MFEVTYIDIEMIRANPYQPVTRLQPGSADVQALAADILRNGLINPPSGRVLQNGRDIVPPADFDRFLDKFDDGAGAIVVQLAEGHHRWLAYQWLAENAPDIYRSRFDALPVRLECLSNQQMANRCWSENMARRDLTPLEQAQSIQRIMFDFNLNQRDAAAQLGLDRSTIANKLRLLDLPSDILNALHAGDLSERQAMALLPVYSLHSEARAAAQKHVLGGWLTRIEEMRDLNSADIRRKVDAVMTAITRPIPDHLLDYRVTDARAISDTCRACEQRHKQSNRCPNEACIALKTRLALDDRLTAAAVELGIPAVRDGKGLISFYNIGGDPDHPIKRRALQCDRLVVAPASNYDTWRPAGEGDLAAYHCRTTGAACECKVDRAADTPEYAAYQARYAVERARHEWLLARMRILTNAVAAKLEATIAPAWLESWKETNYRALYGNDPTPTAAFIADGITIRLRGHNAASTDEMLIATLMKHVEFAAARDIALPADYTDITGCPPLPAENPLPGTGGENE